MRKIKLTALILVVTVCLLFVFIACNKGNDRVEDAKNLAYAKIAMAQENIPTALSNTGNYSAYNSFSAKLVNSLYVDKGNLLLSPLSIYLALGMTANAASGETLEGFATALGLSLEDLNEFCGALYGYFLETEKANNVKIANSIWFDSSSVGSLPKDEFLRTNAMYYGADVFKEDFKVAKTLKQINQWVSDRTGGMIPSILDRIDEFVIAYLINTLYLDSMWEHNTLGAFDGRFTDANGYVTTKKFLNSNNDYAYTHSKNAVALISNLKNGLAFIGILPNGDLDSYMNVFDGAELNSILNNVDRSKDVIGQFPEFSFAYSSKLNDTLKFFGMERAFDENYADFSKGFDTSGGNVFISEVMHKTKIDVTKYGVRAAAATSVAMGVKSSAPDEREKISIILDRPFAFVLMDTTYNIPLFVGAYNG